MFAFTVNLHVLAVNKSVTRYDGRHFWARLQECEKRLLASSRLSVRLSARNNLTSTGRIFMKSDTSIFRKPVEKNEV
jgi:hypothetical protein